MPDSKKNRRGEKGMNRTGIARRAEEPVLGEEALKEALAEISAAPKVASTSGAATESGGCTGHAQAGAESAPKTVSQVLGEVVWLMTQSPRHKSIPLGDLEWLVMPAILLKQFRIFYKGEQPVGVAVWALVDDLVAKRIDTGEKRLTAAEWKSGHHMRILDTIAPFGAEVEMREQVALTAKKT
jgi:cytolysin-activating lysine-acyltransferase